MCGVIFNPLGIFKNLLKACCVYAVWVCLNLKCTGAGHVVMSAGVGGEENGAYLIAQPQPGTPSLRSTQNVGGIPLGGK